MSAAEPALIVFDTLEFGVFFVAVFFFYYALRQRLQNRLLLAASYFFYGFWDWRFLGLIVFSTLLDYFCGRAIAASDDPARRRSFLTLSLAGNLGVLGFFKYFNFFVETARPLLEALGLGSNGFVLDVVLPVGISFYTFQTLSYTIDIYRGDLTPTKGLLDFALFVSFFPQLVSGPIERARRLLPQITRPRAFDRKRFEEGCWLIFWGLYKKVDGYLLDSGDHKM